MTGFQSPSTAQFCDSSSCSSCTANSQCHWCIDFNFCESSELRILQCGGTAFTTSCSPPQTQTQTQTPTPPLDGTPHSISTGAIVGIVIGTVVVLLVVAIALYYIKRRSSNITTTVTMPNTEPEQMVKNSGLPAEVTQWILMSLEKSGELTGEDEEVVRKLFDQYLDGKEINIRRVHAIADEAKTKLFITEFQQTSLPPCHKSLPENIDDNLKSLIHTKCDPFNIPNSPFLLPVVHGTCKGTAEIVAAEGFRNMSTTDAGYYGSGIYFSTSSIYTLPYWGQHSKPAIIISLILPGRIRPIFEKITGHPVVGCDSHFVRVSSKGEPFKSQNNEKEYDEIVMTQQSRILPLFIVEPKKTIQKLYNILIPVAKGRAQVGGDLEDFTEKRRTAIEMLIMDEEEIN